MWCTNFWTKRSSRKLIKVRRASFKVIFNYKNQNVEYDLLRCAAVQFGKEERTASVSRDVAKQATSKYFSLLIA
jgi:hypothetical protein